MPWLFITTLFIFILFVPTGYSTHHILVFFIGLVGVGASLVLFGLTATKKWKGYGELKPISWFFRLLAIGIGFFVLQLANQYYVDVKYYLDGETETVSGVPTEIIDFEANRELVKTVTVVIDDQRFDVAVKAKYFLEVGNMEDKTFVIHYLPRTKWVVNYEVIEE
ncbi:hypothetical protein ACFYKX_03450 [Cytobacillus sp. FJAT-54145]|uniref:Uncharacterized protein n=1 Tax=Cytobacillus spartinae TaxID=3299023 RepID=A0ABW6K664_9BACI